MPTTPDARQQPLRSWSESIGAKRDPKLYARILENENQTYISYLREYQDEDDSEEEDPEEGQRDGEVQVEELRSTQGQIVNNNEHPLTTHSSGDDINLMKNFMAGLTCEEEDRESLDLVDEVTRFCGERSIAKLNSEDPEDPQSLALLDDRSVIESTIIPREATRTYLGPLTPRKLQEALKTPVGSLGSRSVIC